MSEHNMNHLQYLEIVAAQDVAAVKRKESTYQGSWKRRGGVGAFMMMARKWDRLESMVQSQDHEWNIFDAIAAGPSGTDGTVLAEIRDLRTYLLLIEAEVVARGVVAHTSVVLSQEEIDKLHHEARARPVPAEDSNKHADRTASEVPQRERISPAEWQSLPPRARILWQPYSPSTYRMREIVPLSEGRQWPKLYHPVDNGEGDYACILDRRLVQHTLPPLVEIINNMERDLLPWTHKTLYEEHAGGQGWRLREEYRKAWT